MLGELTNKDKNYRVLFSCIVSGIITCFLFLGFGEITSLLQKALDEKENQTKCLHDIERLMKEKKHLPNKGGFFMKMKPMNFITMVLGLVVGMAIYEGIKMLIQNVF